MLNKIKVLIKLCLILVSTFLSACSACDQGEIKKINTILRENQEIYGLQGCTFNDHIFFRGSLSGEVGIYQYMESEKKIKLIKNFSYIGPVLCSDDGIYFSAKNDVMGLYRYFEGNIETILKNYDCSVAAKRGSEQFLCFRDEGFDGTYSLGLFDISNKSYKPRFSSEKFGLSEGLFFSSGEMVFGVFYDPNTESNYLKAIEPSKGRETSSLKLNCDMFSVISGSDGVLIYRCGSDLKIVNSSLDTIAQ